MAKRTLVRRADNAARISYEDTTSEIIFERFNTATAEWEEAMKIKLPTVVGYTVPVAPQDCINQSMAADSTGVKFTSVVKVKVDARYLKKIRLRASWDASHTDSVTEVRVIGTSSGIIASVSGNTGSDEEAEGTSFSDGELVYVEVAVTTASATAGATTTLTYAVVEFVYEMT